VLQADNSRGFELLLACDIATQLLHSPLLPFSGIRHQVGLPPL